MTAEESHGVSWTDSLKARCLQGWETLSRQAQDRLVGAVVGLPATAVLVIARLLEADPAGHGTHQQLGLGACTVLSLTGWPCPMCGMTTCFTHLAHLEPLAAAVVQPFGVVLFGATLVLAAVGLTDLVSAQGAWRRLLRFSLRHEVPLAVGLLGGMALGWIYKVFEMGVL